MVQGKNASYGGEYVSEALEMIDDSGFDDVLAFSLKSERYVKAQFLFPDMHVRLASTLKKLRSAGVKALFPEYSSNPKSLTEIAKSLNIPVARPINTDGLAPEGHTFESMFRQNTGIIKEALSPSPRP